ncbi:alpha-1,3-mannosyl-glycoprotein 4-beta-N-acetylglucosaminyltransferase C-like [Uloborus diversus]|uniref:alpha-1,3-mannosyl-glycoprotein 4-beta-N-acetylglucosaminyltransferase C-like n=1 Tax=Uloborus diversus TaxID=327109 RepID=UPI002409E4FC|nr:alpha-1,3-mannosyl-glycoprotein 4-beta-N-acetylglucosaminyltransferase C-like [Uloborus diversus]
MPKVDVTEKVALSECLETAKLHGNLSTSNRFLTIGIPTVARRKESYLHKTLKSLTENLDEFESKNLTIIVLFADTDGELRKIRAYETAKLFKDHIQSGLLLLIEILPSFYPTKKITRRTFNDTVDRVKWRSKQVLDFAFMLECARESSEYFLILEDDVVTSQHYVTSIKNFIYEKRNSDWVSLSFSGFFIIGRLMTSEYMKKLSDFLIMFHLEKPVDLLIVQFFDLLVPDIHLVTRRIPGLFQHVGLFSSLDGKVQKAKDRSFGTGSYVFHFENPPADIVTSIGVYKKHYPEHCYGHLNKFFWGSAPKRNDTFDIILHKPRKLNRIFISSGQKSHQHDIIKFAELKIAPVFKQMITNKKADCEGFFTVALFDKGNVDVLLSTIPKITYVQCIRIEFLKKQSNWVLINEISIDAEREE